MEDGASKVSFSIPNERSEHEDIEIGATRSNVPRWKTAQVDSNRRSNEFTDKEKGNLSSLRSPLKLRDVVGAMRADRSTRAQKRQSMLKRAISVREKPGSAANVHRRQLSSGGKAEEPSDIINYTFERFDISDAVAWLMEHSLWKILVFFFIAFMLLILLFAVLLSFQRGGISTPHDRSASLLECLWLSLQTFTTVGYGTYSPTRKYTNFVSSVNAFVGQLYYAMVTVVFLAHLMTPSPHWKLADVLTVHENDEGQIVLEARFMIAPGQVYYDVEVFAQVELRKLNKSSTEPHSGTYVVDLLLEHDHAFVRTGITSVKHIVDDDSALRALQEEDLSTIPKNIEAIIIKIQAKDPRLRSMATKAKQFPRQAIMLNHRFSEMTVATESGEFVMDCSKLSKTDAVLTESRRHSSPHPDHIQEEDEQRQSDWSDFMNPLRERLSAIRASQRDQQHFNYESSTLRSGGLVIEKLTTELIWVERRLLLDGSTLKL